MHPNSLKAYAEEKPKLLNRREAIMENVRQCGPGTDRQIRDRMGFTDMNQVRPRITELIDKGKLVETKTVKDPSTGKSVRVVSRPSKFLWGD